MRINGKGDLHIILKFLSNMGQVDYHVEYQIT
jgi:hypothetical protein